MGEKPKILFDEVFANSWWSEQTDFPPCDEWQADIEKHLQFMWDKGWLIKIKRKLQSRNYDSFLSEIFAAYFVEKNLGFEVTTWNPKTKDGRDVEFCIKDKADSDIFCEVKSPGWQGQLTEEERQSGRAKRPKYLMVEARPIASYKHIRRTIKKSYKKFLSGEENLLIITDNFFQPTAMKPRFNSKLVRDIPFNIYLALYNPQENTYGGKDFEMANYKNLSGILFLNNRFLDKFFAWFEANPNAKTPLNRKFIAEAAHAIEHRKNNETKMEK